MDLQQVLGAVKLPWKQDTPPPVVQSLPWTPDMEGRKIEMIPLPHPHNKDMRDFFERLQKNEKNPAEPPEMCMRDKGSPTVDDIRGFREPGQWIKDKVNALFPEDGKEITVTKPSEWLRDKMEDLFSRKGEKGGVVKGMDQTTPELPKGKLDPDWKFGPLPELEDCIPEDTKDHLIYEVRKGDTITDIINKRYEPENDADRKRMIDAVAQRNGLTEGADINNIEVGKKLELPCDPTPDKYGPKVDWGKVEADTRQKLEQSGGAAWRPEGHADTMIMPEQPCAPTTSCAVGFSPKF